MKFHLCHCKLVGNRDTFVIIIQVFNQASKQWTLNTVQSSFSSWQDLFVCLCLCFSLNWRRSVKFCTQSYRNVILFSDIDAALTPSWPTNLLLFLLPWMEKSTETHQLKGHRMLFYSVFCWLNACSIDTVYEGPWKMGISGKKKI